MVSKTYEEHSYGAESWSPLRDARQSRMKIDTHEEKDFQVWKHALNACLNFNIIMLDLSQIDQRGHSTPHLQFLHGTVKELLIDDERQKADMNLEINYFRIGAFSLSSVVRWGTFGVLGTSHSCVTPLMSREWIPNEKEKLWLRNLKFPKGTCFCSESL